jgi:hypothetical protein
MVPILTPKMILWHHFNIKDAFLEPEEEEGEAEKNAESLPGMSTGKPIL